MSNLHLDWQHKQMLNSLEGLTAKKNDPIFVFQYSQILRYVVSFLVSMIMVRSALPTADLGRYEIFIFMATSLTFFWSTGIRNAMFAWFPKFGVDDSDKFFQQVFMMLSSISVLLCMMVLLFSKYIFDFFSLGWSLSLLALLIIYILISVPVILTDAILFLQGDAKTLMYYTHWSQGFILLITVVIAYIHPDIQWFIVASVVVYLVRYLYLVRGILRFQSFSFDKKFVHSYIVFSGPLIVTVLLGYGMDFIDGWFVTHYFDASYFPIFRYGAREMPLSALLFSSLSIAMIPQISQSIESGALVKQKVTKLMHWLFPVSGVLMLLSPFAFSLLYNKSYVDSALIFNIYLLILTSRVLLPQSFCLAYHHTSIVVWSGILEIIANVILSYWWMNLWGIFGLAMATVVAYFIQKIILVAYVQSKFGIKLQQYIHLKFYLLYSSALIILFIITLNYLR